MQQATIEDYLEQSKTVFEYAKTNCSYSRVHVNFMARGEPLLNKSVVEGSIFSALDKMCKDYEIEPIYNISTILPKGCYSVDFGSHRPVIYYSYYSDNLEFRKEWLPSAHSPNLAFDFLADYYNRTSVESRIHFAMIDGKNDSVEDFKRLAKRVNDLPYFPQINIVRYNPYDNSRESERIHEFKEYMESHTQATVYVVPKVGYDVKASCGMFVE